MKAKPRAPGPDGIHNNLLKHLPKDTLKILKELLNKIWISADFPQQWRAARVVPIPKPNKDHTDPLSYRPIALTSCLCKVPERMINTRLIWYLEKYRILDRSQCVFRKHRSTPEHLVSLERYLRHAFAQRQQAIGLFFDLEKAYKTTWQYGITRDLHRIGIRDRLPVFVSEYLRERRIRVRIGTTLSDEFYPEEGVPTGGVLAVTCFGLKINELPSCIAKDIFKALFVDDLAICFRGPSLDTIKRHLQQAVNAMQEWATRNAFRFAAHKCKVIHFTAPRSRAQRSPHCEDWKHTSASGGVHEVPWSVVGLAPLISEAHQCAEDTVQGGSQPHPSGRSLEMGRGQRYTLDAVPCHCSFQVWLWLHCVWHGIKHQPTTTGQHS